MGSLHTRPLHDLSTMLADRECSSVEIVHDLLQAIEARDHELHCYLSLDAERAGEEAEVADARRAGGEQNSLLGLPLAVKDVLNVEGDSCTCASRILDGYTALYTATPLQQLRDAGALLVGRTNMDEFAMGSSTENSVAGATRNPWDTSRVSGGSSGGSAAAVAGRIATAAIGTDTGGSIRQPAGFCGCVGLKPTYGRISRYGLVAFASSLDQVGPITRDVEDAAWLLEVLSGHDPLDSTSLDHPVPRYREALKPDLQGMTLGLPRQYFDHDVDNDVKTAVRVAIDQCSELGADIVEVELPYTEYAIAVYYVIATAEASANLARFDGVRYGSRVVAEDPIAMYGGTRGQGFGSEVKRRIILGTYVLSGGYYDAYYLLAQKVRTLLRRDFENVFTSCDALLTPVAPTPAFRVGEKTQDPLQMYLADVFTVPASLAGLPGMSVPCGFSQNGLPIGLQILGSPFGEEAMLRVGYAYEQATEWHRRVPEGMA